MLKAFFCAALMAVSVASVPTLADDGGPWIAAAFNKETLSGGFAEGVATREDAIGVSMEACGTANKDGGCEVMLIHEGGCISDARNPDGSSLGLGHGATIEAARADAVKECAASGKYADCAVHTSFCAGQN
ncbi:MAG: DUF4189 domain-containing protein [Litorimonas sp.]